MEKQKISIESSYSIPNLKFDVESGKIRLPNFQREQVWGKSKILKLLDSIYNQFPIGSFFFWNAPRRMKYFYKDFSGVCLQKPKEYEEIKLVLDGQQRIISIFLPIKGLKYNNIDYSKVCFDLDNKCFIFSRAGGDNERYISIKNIVGEEHLKIYDGLTEKRKFVFERCRSRFHTYPLSVINILDQETTSAIDIFERINQGGTRLNLFDLVASGTWSDEFDLRKEVKNVDKEFDKIFGMLDNEVYTETLALFKRENCSRVNQLKLTSEDVIDVWEKSIACINLAVYHLRNNFGAVNYDFVPYYTLIPVLSYYFFISKKRSIQKEHLEQIKKWFWKVSFSERYGSTTLSRMSEDAKKIENMVKKDAEIKLPAIGLDTELFYKIRIGQNSAVKKAVICMLSSLRPRHFENGVPISLGNDYFSQYNKKQAHHIFPVKFLEKKDFDVSPHKLANFCFIPAELNNYIKDKSPKDYFSKFQKNKEFKKIMATHLIPVDEDSGIWTNDYNLFLRQRCELFLKQAKKMIK